VAGALFGAQPLCILRHRACADSANPFLPYPHYRTTAFFVALARCYLHRLLRFTLHTTTAPASTTAALLLRSSAWNTTGSPPTPALQILSRLPVALSLSAPPYTLPAAALPATCRSGRPPSCLSGAAKSCRKTRADGGRLLTSSAAASWKGLGGLHGILRWGMAEGRRGVTFWDVGRRLAPRREGERAFAATCGLRVARYPSTPRCGASGGLNLPGALRQA